MKLIKRQKNSLVFFFLLGAFIFVNTQDAHSKDSPTDQTTVKTETSAATTETKNNTKTQETVSSTPRIKTGTWGTDTLGENVIYFFDKNDENYFLTNFALCPITIDGISYKTSEYYFQAMKFPENPELQKQIRNMPKASDTKKFAFEHRDKMRKDWFAVSMDIMKKAVLAKFTQNADAQHLLLSTSDKTLVENNPNDSFWAAGTDGNGTNHTGLVIMEIRKQLQVEQAQTEKNKLFHTSIKKILLP